MEEEKFITGYCRQLDESRMVCIVYHGSSLEECDCCYGGCVYEMECQVAKQIREALSAE